VDAAKNSVMAFAIKKRINTELVIDRTAPPNIGETQVRDMTDKGNQRNGILWLEGYIYFVLNCYVVVKGVVVLASILT